MTDSRMSLEFSAMPTSTGSSRLRSSLFLRMNARMVPLRIAANERAMSFMFQKRHSFKARGARFIIGRMKLSAVLSNDPKSKLFSLEKN